MKNYWAICALACAGTAAHAQSNVTMYGTIDQYIGYIRSNSGAHITGLNDGAYLRSRLGFRGVEDIGGGYQVKFTLEQGFSTDTGAYADSGRLFDRQAWIGIGGRFGELRAGRQNTEVFITGSAIDYTGRTMFGSIINSFGVPSRYDNDISYRTPRIGGLEAVVHHALPENGAATRGNQGLWQFALDFTRGPIRTGYAGLLAKPNDVTAIVRKNVEYHHVYFNYAYGKGTLYASAARSNNSTANANGLNATGILNNISAPNNFFPGTDLNAGRFYNMWELSADYRVSPQFRLGVLYGALHDTTGKDGGARGGNIGGYYDLSKRTMLYGAANVMRNEANAGFRFSGSGAPSANLAGSDVNGRRLTGLQLGILHKF